jgi:hypothetical protein
VLKERSLRFTADAIMVIGAANIFLLATMFYVGYVRGKAIAKAGIPSALAEEKSGETLEPRLRSDREAKPDWESKPQGSSTEADSRKTAVPKEVAAPGSEEKVAKTVFVIQAASYNNNREQEKLAKLACTALTEQGFEYVKLYLLGREKQNIGLCVGETQKKEDLEKTLDKVREYKDLQGRKPFEDAFIREIAPRQ